MWQVYVKELLELSRDRKTLMFVILLPILIFPVIFGLIALVAANVTASKQAEEHRYVIIHAERAPAPVAPARHGSTSPRQPTPQR